MDAFRCEKCLNFNFQIWLCFANNVFVKQIGGATFPTFHFKFLGSKFRVLEYCRFLGLRPRPDCLTFPRFPHLYPLFPARTHETLRIQNGGRYYFNFNCIFFAIKQTPRSSYGNIFIITHDILYCFSRWNEAVYFWVFFFLKKVFKF